jgi:hypothetical protein
MKKAAQLSATCSSSASGEHIADPTRMRMGQPQVALDEKGAAIVVTILCAACDEEATAAIPIGALDWTSGD